VSGGVASTCLFSPYRQRCSLGLRGNGSCQGASDIIRVDVEVIAGLWVKDSNGSRDHQPGRRADGCRCARCNLDDPVSDPDAGVRERLTFGQFPSDDAHYFRLRANLL
jgi:hypothetical protein